MNASRLVDRLDGVKATGPSRWIARCPAHDDRSPSLSVRELDDGRVLLHDFGGCDLHAVLDALGLALADLFPERPAEHHCAPSRSRISRIDALTSIDHEALVVAVVGADVLEHREIDEPTWERLAQAVHRIGERRAIVAPSKVRTTP